MRILFSHEHSIASLPVDRPDRAIPRGFTRHHVDGIARDQSFDGAIRATLSRGPGRCMRR